MRRVNRIMKNPDYLVYLNKIREYEKDRIYCGHDIEHFLSVSRIAYILAMENNIDIDKEIIYAAGILHDIGRWMEYEKGDDHAVASSLLAEKILNDSGFLKEEIMEISAAIKGHRKKSGEEKVSTLESILKKADHLSRNCGFCNSLKSCKRFEDGKEPFFTY